MKNKVIKNVSIIAILVLMTLCAMASGGSGSSSGGSGGVKKTCVSCNGKGKVQQYYTNDPNEAPHWETCALCHGEGYYYE